MDSVDHRSDCIRQQNFRLVQFETNCRHFKVYLKWKIFTIQGKKNIVKKKTLLVTSNFSFSHNVFYSYISLVHQNEVLCGNGLICCVQMLSI